MRRVGRVGCAVIVVASVWMTVAAPVAGAAGSPTCGGVVGTVHGHHVVADYVDGESHDVMTWPPAGQVDAAGGAAMPGAPGARGHMLVGIAPGASFCVSQSQSNGSHL